MKRWILSLLVACSLAPNAAAETSVPSPANSSVDPCLVVCPAGDVVFHVTVRDLASNPVLNSSVVIEFCDCPGVSLCPQTPTDPYTRLSACRIAKVSDAAGQADFGIRAGGGCSAHGARVIADGIILAQRNVASPDQDANLIVQNADHALASAKVGGTDPTADFDCDGTVTQTDAQSLVPHSGHVCPPPDPTPAQRRTWGSVKVIYR